MRYICLRKSKDFSYLKVTYTFLVFLVTYIPVFYLPLSFNVLSFSTIIVKYSIDNNNNNHNNNLEMYYELGVFTV